MVPMVQNKIKKINTKPKCFVKSWFSGCKIITNNIGWYFWDSYPTWKIVIVRS